MMLLKPAVAKVESHQTASVMSVTSMDVTFVNHAWWIWLHSTWEHVSVLSEEGESQVEGVQGWIHAGDTGAAGLAGLCYFFHLCPKCKCWIERTETLTVMQFEVLVPTEAPPRLVMSALWCAVEMIQTNIFLEIKDMIYSNLRWRNSSLNVTCDNLLLK